MSEIMEDLQIIEKDGGYAAVYQGMTSEVSPTREECQRRAEDAIAYMRAEKRVGHAPSNVDVIEEKVSMHLGGAPRTTDEVVNLFECSVGHCSICGIGEVYRLYAESVAAICTNHECNQPYLFLNDTKYRLWNISTDGAFPSPIPSWIAEIVDRNRAAYSHELRLMREYKLTERTLKSYEPVTLRNVTAVCPETRCIGLGFNQPGGNIIRVKIPMNSANDLASAIWSVVRNHTNKPMKRRRGK